MRAWTGLINTATVLAPVCILLFWGASYLLACAEFLANPGVPLQMEYLAPSGERLAITASSYVFDTKDGDLTLVQPKVATSQGAVLFYADRIDAYNLPILLGENRRAVVTGKNAFATIRRKHDGALDLFDYLPKQEGPSGNFPFSVNLDRGKIKLIEETGSRPYTQMISLSDVAVEGVGDRWVASSNATFEELGDVNLSVQNQPNYGVWFRGSTDRLEIAPLYRAFRDTLEGRRTPVLREIDAQSLIVKGPFEVFVPSEAGAQLQADVQATAERFRYGNDYAAQILSFDGILSAIGAQGHVVARNSGLSADFNGVANWERGLRFDGNLDATANSLSDLPSPLRNQVPRDLIVRGPISFAGRMAFAEPTGVRLNGTAKGSSLSAFQETISTPVFLVDYNDASLALTAQQGVWRGAPIVGSLSVDNATNRLSGSLKLAKLNIGELARRFNIEGFTGVGDVDVLVSGTADDPVAHIRAVSSANYRWSPKAPAYPGKLTIAATLMDDKIQFDQAYMVSAAGSLTATGTYNLANQGLSFTAVGSGIDLNRFDPGLEGIGRFRATVAGNLERPRYQGTAELFGLYVQGQPIPVVTGEFEGDQRNLYAKNLHATKGASSASGQISVRFRDMALDGRFQAKGVQLSDFLDENYLATIDLPDARLGGTLSNPTFNATASADEIIILGSRVNSANGVVTYRNNVLQVDDIEAQVGKGAMSGYLSYDVSKRSGNAVFSAENVPLETIQQVKATGLVSANLSGDIGLSFNANGIVGGSAEGQLADVVVRDTPFGGGDWKLNWSEGRILTGEVFFGGLASSVDLTQLRYDLDSREVSGNVWVRNLPAQDLYKIFRPYLPSLPDQATILLDQTQGTLGLAADISGVLRDDLEVSLRGFNLGNANLTAEGLTIGGRPGGNLNASFNRLGNRWGIDSFTWSGGPIGIDASGSFVEHGAIDIEGRINDADLSYVSMFEPSFGSLVGKVDSEFSLSGSTENPRLVATPFSDNQNELGGVGFLGVDGKPRHIFNFLFSELTVTNWSGGIGGAIGTAKINYQGYTGNLEFSAPFRFPFELVPNEPANAQLTVPNRDIKDVDQLAMFLDPEKSVGTVGGLVTFSGAKDNFTAAGNIGLNAERVVFKQGGQEFRNVAANIQFRPEQLSATLDGESADGGTVHANAAAQIPSVDAILRQFRSGTLEELFGSPLSGQLLSNDLTARVQIGPDGNVASKVTSNLALAGTLKNPAIRGLVEVADGSLTMPSEEEEAGLPFVLPKSPLFDVQVQTTTPFRFKSSTAEIDMSGGGTIQGTPDDLELESQFRVDRGFLRLPTSRVNIERGGIIRPTLTTYGSVITPRVDVELEGKTRVVAPARFGEGAQAYDVTLDVRGDLLEYGGLNLTATSDPPDLSQDEILALLGQLSLIEGLASGVQSGNAESNIRDAVFGIAVPYLLDPITGQIATTLGLDYLTVNISALDGATIYFAKTLGRNLTLQGSRQVTQVNHNYPTKYDLRLAYQFRFGSRRDRRRLNFIVGLDEVRPWKIAVEYTFRF